MRSSRSQDTESRVTLHTVTSDNWRDVAALELTEVQRAFVAEPSYYLALCCYGDDWHPLAISTDALSYSPSNTAARHLYQTLGFVETDEWEGDEIVARLSVDDLMDTAHRSFNHGDHTSSCSAGFPFNLSAIDRLLSEAYGL